MAKVEKPRRWVTLRVEDAELLERVKREVEKALGVRMSFGQVVAYLASQFGKKA